LPAYAWLRFHLVEPLGFSLEERRCVAGMDYWDKCDAHMAVLRSLRQESGGARFLLDERNGPTGPSTEHGDHPLRARTAIARVFAANAEHCLKISCGRRREA
jgi:tRNA(Leu) C34 or U34 (ribose-2'-O)-methylase TrmL